MSNTLTGDHDLALEMSESTLAAFARESLGGVQPFSSSAGSGTLSVADVSVRLLTARSTPWIELTMRIADGGIDFTTPIGGAQVAVSLRDFRGTMSLAVPIAVASRSGAAVLAVDLSAAELPATVFVLDAGVHAALAQQLTAQGVPPSYVAFILWYLFEDALPKGIRAQGVKDLKLDGYGLDPAADLGFAVDANGRRVFARLELAMRAASGGAPPVLVAAGTLQQAHLAAASLAAKSRVVLDASHGLSLTLDPEAFRDGILCPALAARLGTAPGSLCPACGTGGPFSLKGMITSGHVPTVSLTSVSVSFTDGAILLGAHVSGDVTTGDSGGGISLGFELDAAAAVTLSIVAGELVPSVRVSPLSLRFDTDLLDVFVGPAVSILKAIAGSVLASLAQGFGQVFADAGSQAARIELPARIGGVPVSIDSVVIHPEGITVQAAMPRVMRPARRPSLRITERTSVSRTRVGEGVAAQATCVNASYKYVDYAAAITMTLEAVPHELAPNVQYRWFIGGRLVGAGDRTMRVEATIEVANGVYEDRDVTLTTSLSPDGRTLVLRNAVSDGSYVLFVRVEADDQLELYEQVQLFSIDGAQREWEPGYLVHAMRCLAASVKDDRLRIRSPKSDGPDWTVIDRYVRKDEIIPDAFLPRPPRPGDDPWRTRDVLTDWFRAGRGGYYRTALGDLRVRTALLEAGNDFAGFLGSEIARQGDPRVRLEQRRRDLLAKYDRSPCR